mmetsp:Transcript_13494/g.26543  ORF Transcript_13494/g.26543 Transcript_13494/m.26543 type:complete len:254 (+) Transcript_13494:130-891(+)
MRSVTGRRITHCWVSPQDLPGGCLSGIGLDTQRGPRANANLSETKLWQWRVTRGFRRAKRRDVASSCTATYSSGAAIATRIIEANASAIIAASATRTITGTGSKSFARCSRRRCVCSFVLQCGTLLGICFLQCPRLHRIFLPMSLHLGMHFKLLLICRPLVFILLPREFILDLLLLIVQNSGVCLLFQHGTLLMRCLLQAHQLVACLLVDAHLLSLQLLVHLDVVVLLLLLCRLPEGMLLDLILLLKHCGTLL